MRLSKSARNKWLATCLFSATVLTGFHLQQMSVRASETQNTTAVTSTADATTTSSTTTNSVSLTSHSSTSTATSYHSQSSSSSSSTFTSKTSTTKTNSVTTSSVSESSSSTSASSTPTKDLPQDNQTDHATTDQTGQLVVNTFNAITNEKIDGDAFTGHYQGLVGAAIKDKSALIAHIPGYSFVGNVDSAVPDRFIGGTQIANLYYKPLSTIVVRYVASPNKLLWTYSIPTTYATQGQLFTTTDNLIPFAGYKLHHVSGDVSGIINQTVNSPRDPNPIVITYYYEPEPGSISTLDTSNWVITSKTTPIGLTGKYSFSMYVQRDQLSPIEIGRYGIQQTEADQIGTDGGPSDNGSIGEKGSTGTIETNAQTQTTPVSLPTAPSVPTATVNIITETGNPIKQLTVSGLPGTNLRAQIQQELDNLRRNGFAILSNDVKGDTKLGQENSVLTVKVSHPDQQADPFQHSTMPIITQLGQASQSVPQVAQTANKAQSSNNKQHSENTNQAQQNSQKYQQISRTYTTEATSKDTEQTDQVHRDTIANLGQSHQHSAADTGGGGHQLSGLAAYFISLSGKVNLGTIA